MSPARVFGAAALWLVGCYWVAQAAEDAFECSEGNVADSVVFKELQQEARAINKQFCAGLNVSVSENMALRSGVAGFAAQVHQVASARFARTELEKMRPQLDYFTGQLRGGDMLPLSMPVFVVPRAQAPGAPRTYFFNGNQENAGRVTEAVEKTCRVEFGDLPCTAVLEDFANAIYPYQINYNAFRVARTIEKLEELSERWDAFFENGRPQTTLDVIVTTRLERKHLRQRHLVGPPPRQWFALHPEIVMEYVDGAPEGDRFKAGLAVEWAGVNWWEDSWIGVPFGVSFTSLYSDRADVADVGHGVTLHIKNALSIGWVTRSGDDGYFLSLDLLTLFEDKQDRVKKFEKQL